MYRREVETIDNVVKVVQKTYYSIVLGGVLIVVVLGAYVLGNLLARIVHDTDGTSSARDVGITSDFLVVDSKHITNQATVNSLRELIEQAPFASNFARTVALHALFERADVALLKQYWNQVEDLDMINFRLEIQDLIVQRCASLDPMAALSLTTDERVHERRYALLDQVYREWSRANLEDALDYFKTLDESSKLSALTSILREREDLSSETIRNIARHLDHEWIALELSSDAIESPGREWSSFLNQYQDQLEELGNAQMQLMAHIAYAWVLEDGIDAFSKMREKLPHTFSMLETVRIVTHKLLDHDPKLAINLIVDRIQSETDTAYHPLAVELANKWAEVDPIEALDSTFVIGARGLRLRLQHRIVRTWAERQPGTVLTQLNELPDHLQTYARSWALTAIASNSPKQVLRILNNIKEPITRGDIADTLVRGWAQQNLDDTLHWIETDASVVHIQKQLQISAFHSLAESSPQLALQSALTQPIEEGDIGMEANVIGWISQFGRVDTAVSMLPKVREGKTRIHAYNSVMNALLKQSDTTSAIDLLFKLSSVEKPLDLELPLRTLAQNAPDRLFLSLDQIDQSELRAEAARLLYKHHKLTSRFTEEQLAKLQSLIQAESLSRINEAKDEFYRVLLEQE